MKKITIIYESVNEQYSLLIHQNEDWINHQKENKNSSDELMNKPTNNW